MHAPSLLRVACVQMCSGVSIERNLLTAEAFIREAAAQGAEFIATPEGTSLLQRDKKLFLEELTSCEHDKVVAFFSSLARELAVTLLPGSLPVQASSGRALNRSYLFGPDGACLAFYDKIHLFDSNLGAGEVYRESHTFDAGERAVLARTDFGVLGMSICYDLRFPELYRRLARAGATILTIPSAFTCPTGRAHWEILVRARAVECGAFVIAPAQGGQHEDGRKTWGHSLITDPWGRILVQAFDDQPVLLYADLDLSLPDQIRRKLPSLQHDRDFAGP